MWIKWTIAEASTKVSELTVLKIAREYLNLNRYLRSFNGAFFIILVVGCVQAISGLAVTLIRKDRLLSANRLIKFSIGFGICASLMQITNILAYVYFGAQIGTAVFITTLSIIPGVFIDRIFFSTPLVKRQWIGIIIFIFAGYSILNFPPLAVILSLPVWIFLMMANAMLAAANEGFSRATKEMHPMKNNFWVGSTTIVVALIGLSTISVLGFEPIATVSKVPNIFWVIAFVLGIFSLGIVSFKLISYKEHATIGLKKLTMQGSRLILATLVGFLAFGEVITTGTFIGIAGFIIAFILTDNKAWDFISGKLTPSNRIEPNI